MTTENLKKAAELIRNADAIVIGAGAGMGVDSGLPDFRGKQGFWNAYPVAEKLKLSFQDLANPQWFHINPERAWGFYGHRYNLYKETIPHKGFQILLDWLNNAKYGGFVYTSNVDGQFQKGGFNHDQIVECHGSINHLQCVDSCNDEIWSTKNLKIEIDFETLNATSRLPTCPHCGSVARPNILMFGDNSWIHHRSSEQEDLYTSWLQDMTLNNLIFIEIGAGVNIPTVRHECTSRGMPYIRINPTHSSTSDNGIELAMRGMEALEKINSYINLP